MHYYVKCNNVWNNKEIQLLSETGDVLFRVKKTIKPLQRKFEWFDASGKRVYLVDFFPLKVKNRYLVKQNKLDVIRIDAGLHLLHHIEIGKKQYVCKSNLFRIQYSLYDLDLIVGRLQVVKRNKERFFQIEVEDNDIKKAISLYIIAQAQRFWFLRK